MTINVSEVKLSEGFTRSVLHSVLPMVIWAAHFFVSYTSVEVACALHLNRFTLVGVAAPKAWLWIISVAAIAALFIMVVRAARHRGGDAHSNDTAATVRTGTAVLALVGVLWSAVPIALVDGPTICVAVR